MERQTRADHRALQCGHRGERDSLSRQVRFAARENIKSIFIALFSSQGGKTRRAPRALPGEQGEQFCY